MAHNQYASVCYYCGQLVDKQQGHFEKHVLWVNGYLKWRPIHSECVFKQSLEKQTEAQRVKQEGRY